MAANPFDELAHRVNNLLGTIAVQAEVAAADGSLAAHREALRLIAASAQRTHEALQELRGRRGGATGADGPGLTSPA